MFNFKLPDIGEGVFEAELAQLSIQVGDHVQENDVIGVLITDKATVDISSPVTGIVEAIHYQVNDIIKVGESFISFNVEGTSKVSKPVIKKQKITASKKVAINRLDVKEEKETPIAWHLKEPPKRPARSGPQALPSSDLKATPYIRTLAREKGINLASVTPTGPNGRILERDLICCLPHLQSSSSIKKDEQDWTREPLTGMKRMMSEKLSQSYKVIPHVTYVEEIDLTKIEKRRVKEKISSPLPYICHSIIACLPEYPLLNASFDHEKDEIILKKKIHLGFATQTEQGLCVPVIRDAHQYDIQGLIKAIKKTTENVKNGTCQPEDMKGSTFTVSSLGKLGGVLATPLINYPEMAIIGVHRCQTRPCYVNGTLLPREMIHLSISFDHRIIEGAYAASFMACLKKRLEK